jgi:uncharacterized membrane protein
MVDFGLGKVKTVRPAKQLRVQVRQQKKQVRLVKRQAIKQNRVQVRQQKKQFKLKAKATAIPTITQPVAEKLTFLQQMGQIGDVASGLLESQTGQIVMDKLLNKQPLNANEAIVANSIAVANDTDPNTPNVLTSSQFHTIAPQEQQAEAPIVSPQNESPEALSNKIENEITAEPKNNTMLYVGGAVVLAGAIYLMTKKKS